MQNRPLSSYSAFERWVVPFIFGLALMTPATFSAFVLMDAGIDRAFAILMVALSFPALLIPILPRPARNTLLRAGWPARVSFGLPAILTGMILMMFVVFQLGYWPYITLISLFSFAGCSLLLGTLVLFAPSTDAPSILDEFDNKPPTS